MESSWRANVADVGLWGSGVLLYSRVHDSFGAITKHSTDQSTGTYQVFDASDPDQVPTYAYDAPIFPEHPHFPYGNNVEPD